MLPNKPWTRQKLTQMLYHAFIGSLADNAIEIKRPQILASTLVS